MQIRCTAMCWLFAGFFLCDTVCDNWPVTAIGGGMMQY